MERVDNWKWELKSNLEYGYNYDNYLNCFIYGINVSDLEILFKNVFMI